MPPHSCSNNSIIELLNLLRVIDILILVVDTEEIHKSKKLTI